MIDSKKVKKTLLEVLDVINPDIVKNPVFATKLIAEETRRKPNLSLDKDVDLGDSFDNERDSQEFDNKIDDSLLESIDNDDLGTDTDEESSDSIVKDKNVGPYDLIFNIRKIIIAFSQVISEAEQLKKLTENISSNMAPEQQAQWIEQRRFFIETAKEAEKKWSEFKNVLLKFSITPRL